MIIKMALLTALAAISCVFARITWTVRGDWMVWSGSLWGAPFFLLWAGLLLRKLLWETLILRAVRKVET